MTALSPRRPAPVLLPRHSLAFARRQAPAVKAVGSFLPGLTARAFAKFGFTTAQLVVEWPRIVGKELAVVSAPERLKWPPRPQPEEGADGQPPERRGATLVLRVEGARALDIQYKGRQILERVNGYFGYAAVTELRLVQAPLGTRSLQAAAPSARPTLALRAGVGVEGGTEIAAKIADAGLRRALQRLGAHVHGGR